MRMQRMLPAPTQAKKATRTRADPSACSAESCTRKLNQWFAYAEATFATNASVMSKTFWDRDLIRRPAACFVVVVSLTAPLAAQEKPDFSGSWVLESGASGTDIPQTLSLGQSLVRTNV